MKVYCVMEKDVYDCSGDSPDTLCSIWATEEDAEKEAAFFDREFEPYTHYVREERVHESLPTE